AVSDTPTRVTSPPFPPFFALPRRPPTSTLFPYTTLFRSALPVPSSTRLSTWVASLRGGSYPAVFLLGATSGIVAAPCGAMPDVRSEEHTSELQSRENLVCRLLLEKKKHASARSRHRTSSS